MFLADYILVIATHNGAVAAKLRQIAPTLTRAFQDSGYEVTAIQVKVQVTQPPRPQPPRSPISASGRQQLADLAGKLHNSPLKSALQHLINTQNKVSTNHEYVLPRPTKSP